MIVAVFLFFSYRAVSTGKSSSANDYLPENNLYSIIIILLFLFLNKIQLKLEWIEIGNSRSKNTTQKQYFLKTKQKVEGQGLD